MMRRRDVNTVWLVGLALALAACTSNAPPKKTGPQEAAADLSKLPPGFKLDLPTAPISPKKNDVPARFPDGAWSVSGLLAQKTTLLNTEVTVCLPNRRQSLRHPYRSRVCGR